MDGDPDSEKRKISNAIPSIRNIFQSIGLRLASKMDDGFDRWLLAWNFRILPVISGLLYIILLVSQI